MKVEVRVEPLRVIRAEHLVPGVLFGKGIKPISIQVDEKELYHTLHEYGTSQTFKVKVGKTTHTVYIKEVQKDMLNPIHYLNVKLQKVGKGDTITSHIPLVIIGKEQVEKNTVSLHIISDSVEVEYDVGKGVSHIDFDISGVTIEKSLLVKDLVLPKGLRVLEDPEKVLVSLSEVKLPDPEEDEEDEGVKPEPEPDPTKVEAIKQKSE